MARILIVEDDELIRQMYAKFLGMKGYKVETAENGQKALDFLSNTRPDLILLDMNMPELNGKEFLTIIKADNKLKNIPVLIVTGVGEVIEISKCLGLGAMGYIEKPVTLVEVVNKVELVLGPIIEKPESNPLEEGPKKLDDLDLST